MEWVPTKSNKHAANKYLYAEPPTSNLTTQIKLLRCLSPSLIH
uniref:Uncharacterized protein n=1 Tax=Arundo donax TaxID=35708 RepID=A0A0A9HCJ3_ARUDO